MSYLGPEGITCQLEHLCTFSTLQICNILADARPSGRFPAYRKPVSWYLASFELSAQVATEAGCYNDGRV